MVDHAAIHVDDVERAIRTGRGEDGTEPRIGRSEEVRSHGGRLGTDSGAVVPRDLALHEILRGFADEPASLHGRRQRGAVEELDAAGAGEASRVGFSKQLGDEAGSRGVGAPGPHARVAAGGRGIPHDFRERQRGVPSPETRVNHGLHQGIPV